MSWISRKHSGSEQSSRFSGLHSTPHCLRSPRWRRALQAGWAPSCGHTIPLPQKVLHKTHDGKGGGTSACLRVLPGLPLLVCEGSATSPLVRCCAESHTPRDRRPPGRQGPGHPRAKTGGAQRAVWAAWLGRGASIFHGARARAHPAQPESSIVQRSLPSRVLKSHPKHTHRNARRAPPPVLRPAWPGAGEGAEVWAVSGSGNPRPEPLSARRTQPWRLLLSAVRPSLRSADGQEQLA